MKKFDKMEKNRKRRKPMAILTADCKRTFVIENSKIKDFQDKQISDIQKKNIDEIVKKISNVIRKDENE